MTDELRDVARAAHDRTLERFDRIIHAVLQAEGPLMEAKAREDGKEPHEAAKGTDAGWIGGRDFRMVCTMAGLDPEAVQERFDAEISRADPGRVN